MTSIQQLNFNVSWATIFKILLGAILLYVIFIVKDIVIWFIFSLIISILFNYIIDILEKKRIPRLLSATVLYFGVFAILGFFVYKTAPLLFNEFSEFANNFPEYAKKLLPIFDKLGVQFDIDKFSNASVLFQTFQNYINKASTNVINALFAVFGGATATALVLSLSFFISLERNFFEKVMGAFADEKHREYLFGLWRRAKRKVSGWFITRIIGALFVSASTFIVLVIFDVKYAFILSLLAGFLDIVPIIGPLIAGLIICSIVLLSSVSQTLFVLGALIIIQELESHVLIPALFKKLAGLSPVLVLIALAIGGKLWGIAGAILAIPLMGVFFEILKDYLVKKKERAERAAISS